MKKKWLLSLLAAVFVFAGSLAACNNGGDSNSVSDSGSQSEQPSDVCEHTGGQATCTAKAECEICGEEYGELAAHDYTQMKSNTSSHWYECECGAKNVDSIEKHTGGQSSCEAKAECEICGKEYGAYAHEYTKLNYNDSTHWYECECGEKNAFTVVSHTGGEATCTKQAECEVCSAEYGDFATHTGGEATCTEQAECDVCGNAYGELAEHTGGQATCQVKASCDVCGNEYGNFAAHTYTEIDFDELMHWNVCICGEKKENSDKAHDYNVLVSNGTTYRYDCECGAEGETQARKTVEECVDFVVEVEAGREIRVLQLTDVQTISADQKRYASRISGESATNIFNGYQRYIGQVIESYNPDLIIMTGDNTYGEFDDYGEQFLSLIKFMDSFQIPWAPVFGNHDNESNMGVDWQCQQFENSKYCLFKQRTLTGNGNYTVGLTQDGELKRVFYMLDSNGCGAMSAISFANGHGKKDAGFGQDQIDWYSQSMEEIHRSFPEAKLSMAFHIQIYAFEKAMVQYGYKSSTIRTNPINLDTLEEAKANGDFGYIGREPKGAWDSNYKVWNTIKQYGVDSVFVGHEHCNSASIMYEGVRLTYGQKSSTYDRYNLTQADGTITNTSITYTGTPIMGGTYINLSEEDGSIVDAGLYLYDHDLGWEPTTSDKITINNIPEGATVTEFDFNGTDFDTTVLTQSIKGGAVKKVTDTSAVPTGFTDGVYTYTSNDLTCVGIQFQNPVDVDNLLAVFVKMYVSEYSITSGKNPMLRIYDSETNNIISEMYYKDLGGKYGEWVYVDILPLMKATQNPNIVDGKLLPFTLLYRFYGDAAQGDAGKGTLYFDSITVVSDGDIYVSENLKTTEFDVNGTDFDTTVTTDSIKGASVKKVADTSAVPAGFTGDVYSYTTNNFGCVGIKFPQEVNAENLRAIKVRMYVSEYTITSGKTSLLRIYNATTNSILSELSYESMGGKYGEWVTVDILPLIKNASSIIEDGKLAPFTLLYRFYGDTAGTIYFDSITVVSNGDMYDFSAGDDGEQEEGRAYTIERDEKCYQYTIDEFDGVAGALAGGSQVYMAIDEVSYSIKFNMTAQTFNGGLCVFGYTNSSYPQGGISVILRQSGVEINKGTGTTTLKVGTVYDVEVGFVSLFNGNTVYTFVKVNGKLVAWELVEAYGKTPGNIVILSANNKDAFTLA